MQKHYAEYVKKSNAELEAQKKREELGKWKQKTGKYTPKNQSLPTYSDGGINEFQNENLYLLHRQYTDDMPCRDSFAKIFVY